MTKTYCTTHRREGRKVKFGGQRRVEEGEIERKHGAAQCLRKQREMHNYLLTLFIITRVTWQPYFSMKIEDKKCNELSYYVQKNITKSNK